MTKEDIQKQIKVMIENQNWEGIKNCLSKFSKPKTSTEYYSYPMRLLSKTKMTEESCWIWEGGKKENGYGNFKYKDKIIGVHRAAYLIWKGEIPKDYYVCHACDNPSCVNPDHLWVGTNKENMQDCVQKGRFPRIQRKKSDEGISRKKLLARIRRRRYNAKKGDYDYSTEKEDIARLHSLKT